MTKETNLTFKCSLIVLDILVQTSSCLSLEDNVLTISSKHQLPDAEKILVVISFGPNEESTITLELCGTIFSQGNPDLFDITFPKSQPAWSHFTNLLSYA